VIQKEFDIREGSIRELYAILEETKPNNIFLVTGKKSYTSCGAKDFLKPLLTKYDITTFSDFELNPKIEDVKKGIELYNESDCDLVIAVGGGSVMDVAKSINILAAQELSPEGYVTKKNNIISKGKPLVAIPTTSGTGSEATHFSVIYIDKVKHSLAHPFMLPDYAIVDPKLTTNVPKYITACTGFDALSQAIESFWSVNSTSESRAYSKSAMKLLVENLKEAVLSPSTHSRTNVAKSSNLAGKAINIAKTTAAHAVSYPITSYFGVPHGHAVALTLPSMLEYNASVSEKDCQDKRGLEFVKARMDELVNILGAKNPKDASSTISLLMKDVGLENRLRAVGIKTQEDKDLIVKHGFNPERVKNNPRVLSKEKLKRILDSLDYS